MVSYAHRRATTLFDAFGPDARGLGAGRPTEVAQLLDGRPRKLRFLSEAQLETAGAQGAALAAATRSQRQENQRATRRAAQEVYAHIADGLGTEAGFRSGAELAAAVGYDESLLAEVPASAVDRFVGLGCPWWAGPAAPGARVLDLGCGAGLDSFVAAAMVGPDGCVVAADLSPGMVEQVVRSIDDARISSVRPLVAAALEVPLRDASVDLVTANGVLVLFRDARPALDEIRRVLRPGGRLQFADTTFGSRDEDPSTATDLRWWNRLRQGRPFVREVVEGLVAAGFVDVAVGPTVDPFVAGMDAADITAHGFVAVRPSDPR